MALSMGITVSEGFPGQQMEGFGLSSTTEVQQSMGFQQCHPDDGRLTHFRLFEYDVKDMYFRISVPAALEAVEACLRLARERLGRQWVAISRFHRHEDRMGTGSERLYRNYRLAALLEFVKFELQGNHYARVGYIGYEQLHGVPMGGEASAQIAAAYCLIRDIRTRVSSQCAGFTFFRFRDNLPGILDSRRTDVATIGNFFTEVYDLPMKLEATGCELTTLEMRVVLVADELGYFMKPQYYDVLKQGFLDKSYKMPAVWSPNRRIFLQSVIPAHLLKCVQYASSTICQNIGLVNCVFGYIYAGLPWQDVLYRLIRYAVYHRLPKHLCRMLELLLQRHSDYFPP